MKTENRKALWISLALLVILGGILALMMVKPWSNKKTVKFFGDQIDRFCINDSCLQKDGSNWQVTTGDMTVPSNSEVDNDYASKLSTIVLGDIISTNVDNFASLGIGESQVIISANGRSLEIGKINSNYDGTYVREKNGKTIYNIGVVLEKNNLLNADLWINKTITNLAVLQTNKITVSKGSKVLEFVPKNNIWDDPKWMQKVDALTAGSFLSNFKPGEEVKTTITVETENNKVTMTLGKNNSVFWVTTDGKYYYSISSDDYNLLTGKIK